MAGGCRVAVNKGRCEAMAKKKTTVYLDESVLRATKVFAARTGRREYEIVDAALRGYLGLSAVEAVWQRSPLTEEEATQLAYQELQAMRRERVSPQ